MIIVKVVLPVPIRECFQYFMPKSMIPIIGGRVIVPFRSKDTIGIVMSFYNQKNTNEINLQFIKSSIDKKSIYNDVLLRVLTWLSKYYYIPIGNVLFSILPKYLRKIFLINNTNYNYSISLSEIKKKNTNKFNLIRIITKFCPIFFPNKHGIYNQDIEQFYLFNFYIIESISKKQFKKFFCYKNVFCIGFNHIIKKNFFLNKKIITPINKILIKNCFSSWLITKTSLLLKIKFYLGLIKEILKKNLQILILVPFIKDIYKILFFLKKYFNIRIDIIHPELNDEIYLKKWLRTKNGQNNIIIGTKNSIFFPFLRLGLIIIHEEHHLKYKNLDKYKYNVRDIAVLRAYKEKIPIILDSNTPSLKTLHNILHKKCSYINFVNKKKFIFLKNNIIDLKKEKIKFGLSWTLINEIFNNIKKNNSVLLIFNKFSFFLFGVVCSNCKWIAKCHICNNYLETKKYDNFLFCRNCIISLKKPYSCFICGFFSLKVFNFGLKTIKTSLKKIFYTIPLFFLFNIKNIETKQLKIKFFKFPNFSPCLIITTEKIVYNYYFPNVKFIALVNVDHYLFSFHFRAIEYFLQFYFNLINLIGKNEKLLKILIQTSFPNNKYLLELNNIDYFSFARNLFFARKKHFLPPWSIQATLYSESKIFEKSFIFLKFIRFILKKKSKKDNVFFWFFGPYPNFLSKNKKKYFYQLSIHCSSGLYLKNALQESLDIVQNFDISRNVKWFVDMDVN
ncbi:primosomal protein N' [Buchnera aphidicola]|uniref:replication restart helicase PriA n=1 Tax=Buchnera aphidicola TaxID=9 RepID=UPI00346431D3